MRLCTNCTKYKSDDKTARCESYYWGSTDKTKSKIFNPMMFECIDYDGIDNKSNFEDDHLFDLFLTMSR